MSGYHSPLVCYGRGSSGRTSVEESEERPWAPEIGEVFAIEISRLSLQVVSLSESLGSRTEIMISPAGTTQHRHAPLNERVARTGRLNEDDSDMALADHRDPRFVGVTLQITGQLSLRR